MLGLALLAGAAGAALCSDPPANPAPCGSSQAHVALCHFSGAAEVSLALADSSGAALLSEDSAAPGGGNERTKGVGDARPTG